MVQLEEPYQRGWKRSFILREDVARCHAAEFYAILLAKINTETYSTNKGFTHKKRRRGKKSARGKTTAACRLLYLGMESSKM